MHDIYYFEKEEQIQNSRRVMSLKYEFWQIGKRYAYKTKCILWLHVAEYNHEK